MTTLNPPHSALTPADIASVSPALAGLTKIRIVDDLWKRPGLSKKDRYIATTSILIARMQTIGMLHYFNAALDNGVTPAELSEIVTQLAFYAGWSSAYSAVNVLKDIFVQRGIGSDQLPEIDPPLLSLEDAVPDESVRAGFINAAIGPVSPALQHFTDDALYHHMWLRPGLATRDRNLATISAMMALGQIEFLPFYLGRAVAKGITKEQIGEVLAHVAFYAGWPFAISATQVVGGFFGSQPGPVAA
jgi:4-carboxymuconolactone decarboxylase